FVRIHFVIRTENKACLDIDKLVSGEESATHRVLNTFGNRLDELTRNGAAGDLVFEYETFARSRFDLHLDVAELAAAARLFLEDLLARCRHRDSFAIRDLRFTDV